jgi:hypothetical protein
MLMEIFMTGFGKMIRHMDMASILISMKPDIKVIGKKTNNTGKVSKHGPMVQAMRVNISMIRKKAKVSFSGQMAENTRETGRMENSMELVFTLLPQAKLKGESGMKARESHGLIDWVISSTL